MKKRSGKRLGVIHLRRTGGKDRRDLANLGVHRVRVQVLGIQSHEDVISEKEDNHYIRNTRGPLDPHVGSCIGASCEKARDFGYGDREIARGDILTAGGSVGHSGA
jgi:hypothetical protein